MSRIDDLIAELCPDGVEFKSLGEVGSFIRGTGGLFRGLKSASWDTP